MCGYAFLSEPAPPRTIFRETAAAAATDPSPMTRTERAAVNVLPDYPEAYQAFLREMERLERCGEPSP
jgi:hypothetical protein